MKLSQIILAVAVVLCVGVVQAKDAKPASAKSQDIILKNVQGTVKWTGFGVGKSHTGTIAIKSGEVTLSKGAPTQAEFVLDMKSLDTKDSDKLKGHLKSPDFFDVEKYPEAKFKASSVEPLKSGPDVGAYKMSGDLTIKDKTQPITFSVAITSKDKAYTGTAAAEITDRTKYGIAYHSKQYETVSKLGDKLIEDNIKLDIEITAK